MRFVAAHVHDVEWRRLRCVENRQIVRPLEAPHTETNCLLREMGFRIARAHAAKLRKIALGVGFALPVLFLAGALLGGGAAIALSGPAAAFAICGMLAERWLMFAEATHTVTLYYGARAA